MIQDWHQILYLKKHTFQIKNVVVLQNRASGSHRLYQSQTGEGIHRSIIEAAMLCTLPIHSAFKGIQMVHDNTSQALFTSVNCCIAVVYYIFTLKCTSVTTSSCFEPPPLVQNALLCRLKHFNSNKFRPMQDMEATVEDWIIDRAQSLSHKMY